MRVYSSPHHYWRYTFLRRHCQTLFDDDNNLGLTFAYKTYKLKIEANTSRTPSFSDFIQNYFHPSEGTDLPHYQPVQVHIYNAPDERQREPDAVTTTDQLPEKLLQEGVRKPVVIFAPPGYGKRTTLLFLFDRVLRADERAVPCFVYCDVISEENIAKQVYSQISWSIGLKDQHLNTSQIEGHLKNTESPLIFLFDLDQIATDRESELRNVLGAIKHFAHQVSPAHRVVLTFPKREQFAKTPVYREFGGNCTLWELQPFAPKQAIEYAVSMLPETSIPFINRQGEFIQTPEHLEMFSWLILRCGVDLPEIRSEAHLYLMLTRQLLSDATREWADDMSGQMPDLDAPLESEAHPMDLILQRLAVWMFAHGDVNSISRNDFSGLALAIGNSEWLPRTLRRQDRESVERLWQILSNNPLLQATGHEVAWLCRSVGDFYLGKSVLYDLDDRLGRLETDSQKINAKVSRLSANSSARGFYEQLRELRPEITRTLPTPLENGEKSAQVISKAPPLQPQILIRSEVAIKPWYRRRLVWLFSFTSLVLITILVGVGLYRHFKPPYEPFPPGIKGILVAPFVDENSKVSDYGKKVAGTIEGMLGHHLEQPYHIKIGRVVTNAEQAQQEGKKRNATLVIWGKAIQAEQEERKLIYPQITLVVPEARQYVPNPDARLYAAISELEDIELNSQLVRKPEQLIDFTLGLLNYRRGEYQSAANMFTRAISRGNDSSVEQDKNTSALYFYRGNSFLAQRNYPNSIADYQAAISINPESAESHTNLGGAYNSIGQYDKAIPVLKKAIQLKPDLVMAYINLSSALNGTKQYRASISLLEEAIKLNPDISIVYNNLGIAYRNSGEYDKAATALQRAIELDSDLAIAHLNLANVYTNQKRFDDAIGKFQEAIRLDNTLVEAYNNLGLLYRVQEKYAEAIESLKNAVALAPSLIDAHCNLGDAYFLNQQYDEAIAEYRETVKLDPEHARAYYQLACSYSLKRQVKEALESLKKTIRLDTEYIERAKTDQDFDNIRQTDGFQQLFAHR